MSDDVLVERSDGLVTVTFNRPERKNALDAGFGRRSTPCSPTWRPARPTGPCC